MNKSEDRTPTQILSEYLLSILDEFGEVDEIDWVVGQTFIHTFNLGVLEYGR